nr:trypsin alpha-3-like [Danaus plexippus plexippus]
MEFFRYPYVSAFVYYYPRPDLWVQRCAGTIVSSWHVITSAFCFTGATLPNYRIRGGSTYSMNGGQVVSIREVVKHPEFVETPRKNDIAVVILQEVFRLSGSLNIMYLPPKNIDIPNGIPATVVSWGFESEQGPIHNSLMAITLTTVPLEQCQQIYADDADIKINEAVICANAANSGVCSGDMGAPLVSGGVLIGVASNHKGCGSQNYPDVFTRIDAYVDWIMEVAVAPSS